MRQLHVAQQFKLQLLIFMKMMILERLILLDIIPVSLGIELGNGIIFLKNT